MKSANAKNSGMNSHLTLVVAVCLLAVTTVRAETVNLSTLTGDYIASDGTTLTKTLSGNYKISIADGATVTLDGVKISGTNSTSYQWAGITCEGDATIVLSGKSTVRGFHSSYPAIHVPANKTLTIRGDGSLTASGNGNSAGIGGGFKIACGNIVIEGGTITATGGWGAGIGGGYDAPCGIIHIAGGNVVSTGSNGSAGIGGGYNPEGTTHGSCGDIIITGGTITATGGDNGAGIGGGNKVPCGNISLMGGLIVATGGKNAAGIGGGWMASCGNITIAFAIDRVTATMGDAATPEGKGYGGSCGTVTIADGLNDVTKSSTRTLTSWDGYLADITHDTTALDGMTLFGTLTGDYKVSIADGATVTLEGVTILGVNSFAGINCEGDATIVLSGANTVKGGQNNPGIHVLPDKTVTIRGAGSMTVSSGGSGAGIGSSIYACGNIIIEGGEITAIGGHESAGIGGGYTAACGNVSISGGTITAVGDQGAAGIGAGNSGSCGNITIIGGTISATGGLNAAGIGGGNSGHCGNITIGEGITRVTATKGGSKAVSIGKGGSNYGYCGSITIAKSLEQIESADGSTLIVQPQYAYRITWLDNSGSEIDTTEVAQSEIPAHVPPLPTQTAEAPYRYVFTGWTPEPVAATNDATYMATFALVADLSLLDGDWSPADGDIILSGATPYKVVIPSGINVTIDGVAVAADGSTPSSPSFVDVGAALLAGFAPSEDGTWTLEAYGNLSSGTAEGVTPDMVQVYAADTVADLATASPLTSGVTLKDTQNAIKATLEVTPPSTSDTQFFRVQFSDE